MIRLPQPFRALALSLALSLAALALLMPAAPARAQGQAPGQAYTQALRGALAGDGELAQVYAARGYAPIWTGGDRSAAARRRALLRALEDAPDHALPVGAYPAAALAVEIDAARDPAALGRLEARLATAFSDYAEDIQSGILTPSRVDAGIKRTNPRRGRGATLVAFAKSNPRGFLAALPPQSDEYAALMEARADILDDLARSGGGTRVASGTLRAGQSGAAVAALRTRLAELGYDAGTGANYDAALAGAVRRFQAASNLAADGIAGPATLAEVNRGPADRLEAVIVAMERERWMNFPLGERHVWVNIADFTARIVDGDRVTFATRTVVGANDPRLRSPEFSDVMEYMVVNPTWNVPRSITTREYLPMLQADPGAVPQLRLVDDNGAAVSRGSVNFNAYDAASFPYRLQEPPSQGNALGRVKFMFPNAHAIYLHDTPVKSLFARDRRAYSHGCIRLAEPFGFAETLLDRQGAGAQRRFEAALAGGRERVLPLERPVRVHLVYRTAFLEGREIAFRPDVYGRDARVLRALTQAGVSPGGAGG